jgi:glycosyltransferase involved in cell wall biosynthesis
MKLSISVVVYERPALLLRCLNSLTMQKDKRWDVIIVDDNSSDPMVEKLSLAFLDNHGGAYANSHVKQEERFELCRPSVCLNYAAEHMDGDIWIHLAGDMEFAHENAVGQILDAFEAHPEMQAGYVGCGYRIVDFRTGKIYAPYEVEEAIHKFTGVGIPPDIKENSPFLTEWCVTRRYPDWMKYGERITVAFSVIDGCQLVYRKENRFFWPEEKHFWLGEDAYLVQAISQHAGGLDPICHPETNMMVISNLNEASLTIQGSPQRSYEVSHS